MYKKSKIALHQRQLFYDDNYFIIISCHEKMSERLRIVYNSKKSYVENEMMPAMQAVCFKVAF